jgi:hypothetical protein
LDLRENVPDKENVGPSIHCFARLGDKNAAPVDNILFMIVFNFPRKFEKSASHH